jgi:UPF0716 protein FxsA
MISKLILIFVTIPLVEMLILIKMGELIGFWPTILLVIVTGIVGATLAKMQGFLVLTRIQRELNAGRIPKDEVIEGLLVLIGGIVLLTPGLLTDLCGFALMIPAVRRWVARLLKARFGKMIQGKHQVFVNGYTHSPEYTDDYRIEE